MVHIMLPFRVLPLFAVMRRIDMSLVSGAWSLGASRTMAFFFVFLPLSLPGVLAGSLLVFILSIGFFVTPALLGGLGDTTFVMLIERQVNRLGNWPLGAAMSVILLVATLVLVIVYNRVLSSGWADSTLSNAVWVRLMSLASLGSFLMERIVDAMARTVPPTLRGAPRQRPPPTFPFARIVAWATVLLMIFPIVNPLSDVVQRCPLPAVPACGVFHTVVRELFRAQRLDPAHHHQLRGRPCRDAPSGR